MSHLRSRRGPISAYHEWQQRRANIVVHDWTRYCAEQACNGKRVAIVGNAGYLKELDQGELIDSHDIVIRMNNFRLSGFERQLGHRVEIFFTAFGGHIEFAPDCYRAPMVVSSRPNNFFKIRSDRLFVHRKGKHITQGMRRLGRQELYAPSIDDYARLGRELAAVPTTGYMAIRFVHDFLGPAIAKVFVTGFSFFEGQTHYYSERTMDPVNSHNIPEEKRLINQLLATPLQSGRWHIDERMQQQLTGARGLAGEASA